MEINALRSSEVGVQEASQVIEGFVTKHKRRLRGEAPDLLVQLNQLRDSMKSLAQEPAAPAVKHDANPDKKHKKHKKKHTGEEA